MKKFLTIAITLFFTLSASAQLKPFPFEGAKRKYIIYLPSGYQTNPKEIYPLVINFHGGGLTSAEQMMYTGMNKSAEKHSYIVVYPAGIKNDWNVGFEMSYTNGANDIGFVKALVDSLKREYRINSNAIFATGLSRGGFFCHRLAAEMPSTFAAIASVGGSLPDSVAHFHTSPSKISVMHIQGTLDKIVTYEQKEGAYASAIGTFNYWIKHNGLDGKPVKKTQVNKNKKDGTSLTVMEVTGQNQIVSLVTIEGGGHTWPGADPFNFGYELGLTSSEIAINEEIWKFFLKTIRKQP